MTSENQDQIELWNTQSGLRWTEEQNYLDALLAGVGAEALRRAAAQTGEKVIDIGCGCGASSLALGDAVGATGDVLGVDVSAPMLARARARAAAAGALVRFQEDDASVAALPTGCDLLFSRFGVMFFAEPVVAFAHMRGALKPGGRLAFVCWRAMAENPWMVSPVMAAIQALGAAPPRSDPHAPGPFAFADAARLRKILADAGFADIAIEAFDMPMRIGADAADAAAHSVGVGPLGAMLRETDDAGRALVLAAVTDALAPHATPDGVMLSGATWMVTARSP